MTFLFVLEIVCCTLETDLQNDLQMFYITILFLSSFIENGEKVNDLYLDRVISFNLLTLRLIV